jgi:hypothetical protein
MLQISGRSLKPSWLLMMAAFIVNSFNAGVTGGVTQSAQQVRKHGEQKTLG